MQKPIKLAVGAVGGVVVAAGVVIITASATGLHLAGSSQPAPVTAASPAPAPSMSPQRTPNPAARAVNQAAAMAEAQVLGIQPKELAGDLRQGTTVHMLADQKGISQADFQARFDAALKTLLDQDVQQGTLTTQQEQQALKRLGTRIPNWDQAPAQKRPTPTPTPTS